LEKDEIIDKIMALAKELNECIVSKISGEYVLPEYWELQKKQTELLEQLRAINKTK